LSDDPPHPDRALRMKILVTIKIERGDASRVFLLREFMTIAYVILRVDLKRPLK
tara:strand:- start:704 stop:865 length:162 start_codon:yes stop_codon:yes gene_type:complete